VTVSGNRIGEGQSIIITVSLPSPLSIPITARYTVGGTATPGQDFTLSGVPGQIVIPAGQTSASITLSALTDAAIEKQEVVIVTFNEGAKGKDFAKVFIEKQKKPKKGHGR
jgi:hypothetical protein